VGHRDVTGLVGALALLTRLPVRFAAGQEPGAALPWLPIVGGLLGVFTALVYMLGLLVLPAVVAAAVAIAVLVAVTGALHEDGLADAVDAWGGGSTREETLRVLDDPRIGTYGVLALVLSVLLRVTSIATLSPSAALVGLPAVHAMSRAATVAVMAVSPAARDSGLGARYSISATPLRAAVAVGVALLLSIALLGPWTAVAVVIALVLAWMARRVAMRRIGGVTGDVLGAIEQLVEVALLLLWAGIVRGGGASS
jgi:adenosylcobinamide-GDP ribazoletransferase